MARVLFPNTRMSSINMRGGIREILSRAYELEAVGRKIIHMEIGRPDFDSPLCAKNAAISALNKGDVHYTDMSGKIELRQAIADRYKKQNAIDVDPEHNVIITVGAIEALVATFFTLLEPGDEVIVPIPYFAAYADGVALANGVLVEVPTKMENGFRLQADDLERVITPKTKVLLINSPNNPSGAVLKREDLQEIANIVKKHDIWVISDECYEKFIFEGEHTSIASLPGMADRTVTISAASKTWSMTGWRVGWIVCPSIMRPYLNKCHQNLTTCATSFAQAGVLEAIKHGDNEVNIMVTEYKHRRDLIMKWLSMIDSFEYVVPTGAFYAFPKITSLGMSGFEFCSWLLEDAGVSTVPGEVFGCPGHVRIAFCQSYGYLEEGMRKIKNAIDKKFN